MFTISDTCKYRAVFVQNIHRLLGNELATRQTQARKTTPTGFEKTITEREKKENIDNTFLCMWLC